METNEKLADVLTEFHQRNVRLQKPLDPPPPFEITTTVMTFPSRVEESKKQDEAPPLIAQPRALVRPETEFDFIPNNYTFSNTQLQFFVDWFFRCHNQGTVGEKSYIRVYSGSFWRSVTPAGYGGQVGLAFYGSTWTPPAVDQQGTLVELTGYLYNVPDPARFPIHEAHIYFAMYIEGVDQPHRISERIFAPYTIFALNWYPANNGIGLDLTFHTPGP